MDNKNLNGKIFFRKLTNNIAKDPLLSQVILVTGKYKNPHNEDEFVYKVEHCAITPNDMFCEKTEFYDLMGEENDKNDVTTPIEKTPIEDIRSFVKRIFRGNNG